MLPNLPTDNLYKFMALAGLSVWAFLFYSQEKQVDNLKEQIFKIGLSASEFGIRAEWLDKEVIRLEKIIENSIANEKGEYVHDTNKLEIFVSEKEVLELSENIKEKALQAQLEQSRLKNALERSKSLTEELKSDTLNYTIAMSIAWLFSVLGFYLWYYRVQVYLDKSVKLGSMTSD